MPTLIQVVAQAGQTVYVFIWNALGQIWNTNTSGFETETDANIQYYAISAPSQGGTSTYFATIPTAITTAGTYTWAGYIRLGATPAAGDTPIAQGPFIIPPTASSYVVPSTLAGLITSFRELVEDAPDSKLIEGEMVGGADTPWYPVNGSNTTFQLKNKPLSDYAGSPVYMWLTIIGSGAVTRTQSGFTIADQVNGIVSLTTAPNPGTSGNDGVYFSYNYQDYSDAKYANWLYQAAQMTLAGTTDPTTIPNGLSDAMLQYGVWLYALSRQAFFSRQYDSHAGDSSVSPQTRAQAYAALAKSAKAQADTLRDDYYKRQGQRFAPASATISLGWDPISPIR